MKLLEQAMQESFRVLEEELGYDVKELRATEKLHEDYTRNVEQPEDALSFRATLQKEDREADIDFVLYEKDIANIEGISDILKLQVPHYEHDIMDFITEELLILIRAAALDDIEERATPMELHKIRVLKEKTLRDEITMEQFISRVEDLNESFKID